MNKNDDNNYFAVVISPEFGKCKRWLVQRTLDGKRFNTLMDDCELVYYVDMNFFEQFKIYDVSDFGNIKEVYYTGKQPNCLVELKDENGKAVLRQYSSF